MATHHVVGILSGVGEEIFISLRNLSLLLLLLQLLQLLQLPASLRALQPLLGNINMNQSNVSRGNSTLKYQHSGAEIRDD